MNFPKYEYITDFLTKADTQTKPGYIGAPTTPEERKARKMRNSLRDAEYESVQAAFQQGGYEAIKDLRSEKTV